MKIDFGCGPNKIAPDWHGVDSRPFTGVDTVMNIAERVPLSTLATTHEEKLNLLLKIQEGYKVPFKPWPWADSSIDEAHASHFVEHLNQEERVHFVNELWRVLKPGGKARIICPDFSSGRAYGDMTHCFAEDTELLTESGWCRIVDVTVGTRVPVLDLLTERTAHSHVLGVTNEPYVGEMLHFKTECLDLLVTPNHDLVWRSKDGNSGYWCRRGKEPPRAQLRKSSADTFLRLSGHHPRRGTAVVSWTGEDPQRIRIAADETAQGRVLSGDFDSLAFAELIGWFVSEGHVDTSSSGHYRISIAQSSSANPKKVERICDVIRRIGCSPCVKHDRVVFSSKPLALFLRQLGLSYNKRLPGNVKNLSSRLLRALIQAAVSGDGTPCGTGWAYATTSKALADDMQEIALKAGYRTSLRVEARQGMVSTVNGHTFTANHDMWMVGIYQPKDLWYPIPVKVLYNGRQVCVSVAEHHNILVRRNGCPVWAGNCWPPAAGMWLYYLSAEWRKNNAPHNDGYVCDFTANGNYNLRQDLLARNTEYQVYALSNYKEACQDLIADLICVKP